MFKGVIEVKCGEKGKIPRRGTGNPAGIDFYMPESVTLEAFKPEAVDMQVAVDLPEGFCGLVFGRSSTRYLSVKMSNVIGLIDNDYHGNIVVTMEYNPLFHPKGGNTLTLEEGQCYFQMVIVPYFQVQDMFLVEKFAEETGRGSLAFGSSDLITTAPKIKED